MASEKKNIESTDRMDGAVHETSLVCQTVDQYQLQQERYQLFVEQAADGFYETDLSGRFTFFNDALCRIFGRSRQEMESRHFYDFMDSENARSSARSLNHITDPDTITQIMWEIIQKNGRTHTLEVSTRPIFDADGQRIGFRGMARDVTHKIRDQEEIKHLYAASQEAERRYRAFLKFLPLPLIVQNLDHSVAYINPAFEATFGWTREDLELNPYAHIPPDLVKTTRTGKLRMIQDGALSGLETKRLTKDGRVLDVINDGSLFYNQDNLPAGVVVAFRDITQAKKDAKTSQIIFEITKALLHYSDLDSLLTFISQQAQRLLQVQHAYIILVDSKRKEYYFRAGVLQDSESDHIFSQNRGPLNDSSFAGKVILSGKPYFVNDVIEENVRLLLPPKKLYNMLGVPMELGNQVIGAMVVTNKIDGPFNQEDIALLSSIASIVSLPIENTRMNDELRSSYEEVKALNLAKDHIIDHLSHELRTPLSVLSASLEMLAADECLDRETASRILDRSQRNLRRITDMQSKIADITLNPHQRTQQSLTALLELCTDELESLADLELGPAAGQRLRRRIDEFFKPRVMEPQHISLGPFVAASIDKLKPDFAHRRLDFTVDIQEDAGYVDLPDDVLDKIITGLVRNAVEYTPDGSKVEVSVKDGHDGPMLVVSDYGVGITQENQQLIFSNYFTTADTSRYGTGKPYDFNAGGRGFDLLRLRVFAERYRFKLMMDSQRCRHIPTDADICPGSTAACGYCDSAEHCHQSGGTRFTVQFFSGNDTNALEGPNTNRI